MKNTDLTHNGGFPLTQNRAAYLQAAYTEVLNAMSLIPANDPTVPVIISGMAISGFTDVADGWFAYKGKPTRFVGSSVGVPGFGFAIYIVITATSTPLTFKNASTPNVVNDTTAEIAILVNTTPVDDTHVLLSSLVSYKTAMGITALETRMTTAESNITGLEGYVGGLITDMATVEGDITTLDAEVALGAWADITLATGWTTYGQTPQVRKDGMGRVFIRGSVVAGAGATIVIGTLPAGTAAPYSFNKVCTMNVSGTETLKSLNSGIGISFFDSAYIITTGMEIYLDGLGSWLTT